MKIRTYLSLFNGIGIGSQALKELDIQVDKTYVSEIDKFANQTNMKNHPNSINLGDVTKWREWGIDWSKIDLVTAGFPCQTWSMAGQQMGDKDPRGALFWTTLEVISNVLKYNPNAKWLMENVKMKREFEEYITHHTKEDLGHVEKVLINSALVTAQNRNRWYWSNFEIDQPEDRGIFLIDIIEDTDVVLQLPDDLDNLLKDNIIKADQKMDGISQTRKRSIKNGKGPLDKGNTLTASAYKGMQTNGMTNILTLVDRDKSYCIDANYFKGGNLKSYFEKNRRQLVFCGAMRGRYLVNGVRQDSKGSVAGKTKQRIEMRYDGKTNCLTTVQKDNWVCYPEDDEAKYYYPEELSYRKLTPLECERLQGYPDGYSEGVSNTQRYKQIGNGWTLPVIKHILSKLKE